MARAISELSPKAQAAYRAEPRLAAARNAQVASASSPAPTTSQPSPSMSLPAPDLADWSVPGGTPLEKALVVIGILILGLGVYSRLTGRSINLSLAGFGSPPLSQPALAPSIAARTAAANPAKVGL